MADVIVEDGTNPFVSERDAIHGPYWISPSVGYLIGMFSVVTDQNVLDVYKTTDGGASWTVQDGDNNPNDFNHRSQSAWYDRETPGNTGTVIHIVSVRFSPGIVEYASFDTATDTWGAIRTADTLQINDVSTTTDCGITVSKSGRIYVCARGDFAFDVEDTDHSMRSSSDGFASNNESEASPYSSDEEQVRLYPGTDADEDDISAVVFDAINQDLEFWKFDASANTWGTPDAIDTSILVTGTEGRIQKRFWDAAIRHSDEHILVVYWNDLDVSTGDLRSVDIIQDGPTITQKGDLHQSDGSFMAGIMINQQNGHVFVAYIGSDAGDEALGGNALCYFKLSTNSMTDWGTEQTYGIGGTNLTITSGGHTVGDDGGRWMPVWFESGDFLKVNDGNDIEIAAAVGDLPVGVSSAMGVVVNVAPTEVVQY